MNIFAGNVTLDGNKSVNLDFDYVENLSKDGNKVLFVIGETELKSSKEVVSMLEEKLGKFKNFDISISTEDKIEVVGEGYDEGIYELATFEGEEVNFDEIIDRFAEFEEAVCIREAEVSEKFGNKKIKVDFVY